MLVVPILGMGGVNITVLKLMGMKVGEKIKFFLFGVESEGEIYNIDKKEKTVGVLYEGYKYPNTKTFKKLPKNKKDIPPWYIIK